MAYSSDVDKYIERAQPFARPILRKIRAAFHRACPQIEERLKWSMPSFEYRGIVGSMAAFKAHAVFGFAKPSLIDDPEGWLQPKPDGGMHGSRLTSVRDLPPDAVLVRYVKQAVALNEQGVKLERPAPRKRPPPRTPSDLASALRRVAGASAAFAAFPPSHKREYIEWITEAKQPATRARRIGQAVAWIAVGKPRYRKPMRG